MKQTSIKGWVVALSLLLAVFQGRLLNDLRLDKSDTRDEATYLTLGAWWWESGYVPMNALPIFSYAAMMGLTGNLEDLPPLGSNQALGVEENPHYPHQLRLARLTTMVVTCLGGLALFGAGSFWGVEVALLVQSLWVFSPHILAHGSLATLDGWAAALSCFSLWAWAYLWHRPGVRGVVAAGVAVGLAGACKIPTLGFIGVVVATLVWQGQRGVKEWHRWLWLFVGVVGLSVWVGYGLSVGRVQAGTSFGRFDVGPVPAPNLFRSFLVQYDHGFNKGHSNWVGDEIHYSGWWWYYLACVAMKGTLGCFTLLGIRLWLLKQRRSVEDLFLLSFPLLLFLVFSVGKTQLGIRYLLPAFPCVLLWLSLVLPQSILQWGVRGARYCLVAVAILMVETWAIHPHELMFFNQIVGGPEGGGQVMTQGSDWCQDRRRVGEWAEEKQVESLYVVGCSKMSMKLWGIPLADKPPRCQRSPGIFVVSLTELRRPLEQGSSCMAWIRDEKEIAILGHSFHVYEVK